MVTLPYHVFVRSPSQDESFHIVEGRQRSPERLSTSVFVEISQFSIDFLKINYHVRLIIFMGFPFQFVRRLTKSVTSDVIISSYIYSAIPVTIYHLPSHDCLTGIVESNDRDKLDYLSML